MPLFNVIKWNAAPRVYAWKFPSEEIPSNSQLIVSETQEALFVNQGNFIGPFGAGRHTLNTENYPLLGTILKLPFGGNSPFTAEVWFVQKSYSLEINWGTSDPIHVEDPKYHIFIPIRAFGSYSIQIQDSAKFLRRLVGTLPVFVEKTLKDYFKSIILKHTKDLIAKYFIEKNVSIIQISAHIREISDFLKSEMLKELAEYGLEVVYFNVASISTDNNDPSVVKLRNALAEKAEMEIIGFNYQQKRTFDTMESAAQNQSNGGLINAGLGMGIGMGLGVPMGNTMGHMAENFNMTKQAQKFCSNCGESLSANAKFCPSCGSKIDKI